MKIKKEKEFTLPQLIEWAWKNGTDSKAYISSRGSEIYFDEYGNVVEVYRIEPNAVFTVRVEEEITEETFFKHLIKVTEDGEHYSTDCFKVRDLIHLGTEEIHAYVDGEYKLIWTHEKGLVIE